MTSAWLLDAVQNISENPTLPDAPIPEGFFNNAVHNELFAELATQLEPLKSALLESSPFRPKTITLGVVEYSVDVQDNNAADNFAPHIHPRVVLKPLQPTGSSEVEIEVIVVTRSEAYQDGVAVSVTSQQEMGPDGGRVIYRSFYNSEGTPIVEQRELRFPHSYFPIMSDAARNFSSHFYVLTTSKPLLSLVDTVGNQTAQNIEFGVEVGGYSDQSGHVTLMYFAGEQTLGDPGSLQLSPQQYAASVAQDPNKVAGLTDVAKNYVPTLI